MSDNKDDKKSGIEAESEDKKPARKTSKESIENGGPQGPEPTRYGDWERKGRCVDF